MEKKKRKNRKPLIVVAMLLMVALVVGMGAMTYSRYVSSFNSGTQQATAAQWGYVVTANADSLFGEDYSGTGLAVVNNGGANLVVSASEADKNVVAPGTTGSMTITVSGQAEVLAKLTISVGADPTTIDLKGTKTGAEFTYNPVVWSVKKNTGAAQTGTNLGTLLATLVANTYYDANSTALNDTYTISWSWAYNDSDNVICAKDTIIGYAAAGKTYAQVENALLADGKKVSDYVTSDDYDKIVTELSFSISVKLEQVQSKA